MDGVGLPDYHLSQDQKYRGSWSELGTMSVQSLEVSRGSDACHRLLNSDSVRDSGKKLCLANHCSCLYYDVYDRRGYTCPNSAAAPVLKSFIRL